MDSSIIVHSLGILFGITLLWIGGDFSVYYSVKTARAYNISTFFIGFFILAGGAMLPDFTVALISSYNNANSLAAGEIIGANFTDVALVLGLSMFIAGSMAISRRERKWLLQLLGVAGVLMLSNFFYGEVTQLHGALLIFVFFAFCFIVWKQEAAGFIADQSELETFEETKITLLLLTKLLVSFIVVLLGSMIAVHFSVQLSKCCSLPLETIGATLMGIGSSLPELAVSLTALKRKEYGLALGPTLGTVLGQGTLILGTIALLSPEPISLARLNGSALFMFSSFIIFGYALFREQLGRRSGGVLVSLFCAYLVYHLV